MNTLTRLVVMTLLTLIALSVIAYAQDPILNAWGWLAKPYWPLIGVALPLLVIAGAVTFIVRLRGRWMEEVNEADEGEYAVIQRGLFLLGGAALLWMLLAVLLHAVDLPVPRLTGELTIEPYILIAWSLGSAIFLGEGTWKLTRAAMVRRALRRSPLVPGIRHFRAVVGGGPGILVPLVGGYAAGWYIEVWTETVYKRRVRQEHDVYRTYSDGERHKLRTEVEYQTLKEKVKDHGYLDWDTAPYHVEVDGNRIDVDIETVVFTGTSNTGVIQPSRALPADLLARLAEVDATKFQVASLMFGSAVNVTGLVQRSEAGGLVLRGFPEDRPYLPEAHVVAASR